MAASLEPACCVADEDEVVVDMIKAFYRRPLVEINTVKIRAFPEIIAPSPLD
jgi:hypothetical protein